MKKKLMTALLLATGAFAFADDSAATTLTNALPLEVKQSLVDAKQDRNWFGYMRMGLADSRPTDVTRVLPGLGLGVRYALPLGAIDVSASYTGDNVSASETKSYFYTLPRVSYLYYTAPTKQQSFYAGAGLAYAGLKTTTNATFSGLVPSVSLGYEMNRLEKWCSFVQLDVSQPALSTSTDRPFLSLASAALGPIAEFSVGFGY
jgi:outer membrane translocation and assembly module TamA